MIIEAGDEKFQVDTDRDFGITGILAVEAKAYIIKLSQAILPSYNKLPGTCQRTFSITILETDESWYLQ